MAEIDDDESEVEASESESENAGESAPAEAPSNWPTMPGRFLGLLLLMLFFVPGTPTNSKAAGSTKAEHALYAFTVVNRSATTDPTRALDPNRAVSDREHAVVAFSWRGTLIAYLLEAAGALVLLLAPRVRLPRLPLAGVILASSGYAFRRLGYLTQLLFGRPGAENDRLTRHILVVGLAAPALAVGALGIAGLAARKRWTLPAIAVLAAFVSVGLAPVLHVGVEERLAAACLIAALAFEGMRTARFVFPVQQAASSGT